jgi:hypothetical protein
MKKYLIYGSELAYTCTFKPGIQAAKTCEILASHTIDERRDIVNQIRILAGKDTTVLTTFDREIASNVFGYYRNGYGRFIPSIPYQCIKGDSDDYTSDELDDVFHFQDFPIDLKIGKYMRFLREVSGEIASESHEACVFVPGVKSHVLYTIREKFEGDFKVLLTFDFQSLTGHPINFVKEKTAGKKLYLGASTTSYYYSIMQDWDNLECAINPYDDIDLKDRLIPQLMGMLQDGLLALKDSDNSELSSQLSNFQYKTEMKYETLDDFPLLRALLYIPWHFANDSLKPCEFVSAYTDGRFSRKF